MITVVGSTNVDFVFRVEHFTKEGETQKAIGYEVHPGGKGANQAVATAKMSTKVFFITCFSKDDEGRIHLENFKKLKIEGYEIVDVPTGRAFIEVEEPTGKNRIIIYSGANRLVTPELIEKKAEFIRTSKILLLQNEIPIEANICAAKIAKDAGLLTIFDPAPCENIPLEMLKLVDIITPNEEEFKKLAKEFLKEDVGEDNYEEIVKSFLDLGIRSIIIKMGEKGSVYYDKTRKIFVSAFNVKAVDTTGAGDVYNGIFAANYLKSRDVEKSMIFASAGSAISVTRKGAQTSIPTEMEVIEFIDKHFFS